MFWYFNIVWQLYGFYSLSVWLFCWAKNAHTKCHFLSQHCDPSSPHRLWQDFLCWCLFESSALNSHRWNFYFTKILKYYIFSHNDFSNFQLKLLKVCLAVCFNMLNLEQFDALVTWSNDSWSSSNQNWEGKGCFCGSRVQLLPSMHEDFSSISRPVRKKRQDVKLIDNSQHILLH